MKLPTLKPSSHARYTHEVDVPSSYFGKRLRRHFSSKTEAEAFLRDILDRISRGGSTPITRDEHLLLSRWRTRLSLAEMEAAFEAALDKRTMTTVTVRAYGLIYMDVMDKRHRAGTIGDLHMKDVDYLVPVVTAPPLGDLALPDLTRAHVQDWLDSMTSAPTTRRNRFRMLRAVLNHAVLDGRLTRNPCDGVAVPVGKAPVSIVTPDDLVKLLAAANDPSTMAVFWWLVFGAFAGLRTSEYFRLDWSDVRPDAGELYVSPGKTPNAERWIRFTPPLATTDWSHMPKAGPVCPINERTHQTQRALAYARAGVRVPDNALRHSFGSHHLVRFRDPSDTAAQMGHATPLMTFSAYRRAVPTAQALAYMSIVPPSPASW